MPSPLPLLRLLRVGTLFSPAADVVASFAIAGLPFDATLARAASASVCLYAAGMVWNDIADRRIDAVQRPERPLPSGQIPCWFACALGVALLAIGLAVSPCRLHHALIGALVLAYDFGNKHVPWLGVPLMGSLRALNLATAIGLGVASAGERAQALVIAAVCYGCYISAVTMLGIFEDAPTVRGRAVAALQAAPPLAALCAITTVQGGPWPVPAIAAVPAVWFLRRNARTRDWDRAAIRRSMMLLLLGTMLLTASLCAAAGCLLAALAIAAAIAPARWIARRIALT